MKLSKKLLSILLCAVMMLGSAPLTGLAGLDFPDIKFPDFSKLFASKASASGSSFYTSGFCGKKTEEYPNGENMSWSIDTETGLLTVTGTGEMAGNAFDNDLRIVNAVLSEGITSIGYQAFSDCDNMVSIDVPESVTAIGSESFYGCDSLLEISLPSVTEIPYKAFQICSSLQTVSIPNVIKINNLGLYSCHKLTDIYMPKVESMGQHAIACSACRTLSMPSIKSLGWFSCSNTKIERLDLPDSLISLTDGCFSSSPNLKVVNIGKGIEVLQNVFSSCDNLEQINISPENETYCSVDGIVYNKQQTKFVLVPPAVKGSVYIPENVSEITYSPFAFCKGIQEFRVDDNNQFYSSEDGIIYDKNKTTVIVCPQGKEGTVNINRNTSVVGNNAFRSCQKITEVNLPSVTVIEDSAFYYGGSGASKITSISMPMVEKIGKNSFWGVHIASLESSTIKEIGSWAFAECWLEEVILYDSIEKLSGGAFDNCRRLSKVQIGSGLNSISETTFNGCIAFKEFTVSENNPSFCTVDNILYNKAKTKVIFIPTGIEGEVYIPASVTEFPLTRNLINTWDNLIAINFDSDNNVYSSVDGIVYNKDKSKLLFCPNGKEGVVVADENTTVISGQAFDQCENITEIYLPNVVTIEGGAFAECRSLAKADMPHVETVGIIAFMYCFKLVDAYMPNLKSIGDDAFQGCGFTDFTYPEKVQIIKNHVWGNLQCLTLPNRYAKYTDNLVLTHSNKGCTVHAYCGSPGHVLATKQMLNFESIGHTWLDWYTETPATYESEGVERRDCAYCDGHEERIIPKLERQTYTITFMVDDTVVATIDYPKGATEIEVPDVPQKDRYIGEWEDFSLNDEDITVNAIYTLIKSDEASEIETESEAIHYTYDDDVLFRINASSNAKIIKSVVSQSIPLDIILVVDQSGSMDETLGGNIKKVNALKNTAISFINEVFDNSQSTGAEHRISVVGFGLSGSYQGYQKNENTELLTSPRGIVNISSIRPSDYAGSLLNVNINGEVNSALITAINSIEARGATAADLGLEMAKGVFANSDAEGRQRVVIFLTDGEPTYQSDFQTPVANAAIANAKSLKNEFNAAVYSVGVFEEKYRNNAYINTFMNAISSNYIKADSMRYLNARSSGDYYIMVDNTSALSNVFQTITTEALSHTAPFDNITLIKTLSKYVTLTQPQEEQLRMDVIRKYGITNDDIIVTRNSDGTTVIKINGLKPEEVIEDGKVKYVVSVEFFASFNENAADAGDYLVDSEDSGVMLSPDAEGYEATFSTNIITTTNSQKHFIFTINGEIYAITEKLDGSTPVAPDYEIGDGWEFSGWDVFNKPAVNGSIYDASLTKARRTITWHTADGNIVQYYNEGEFIIPPAVNIEADNFKTFLSWNRSIPTTMPDENIEFTAVYGEHSHNYSSEITKEMTCEEDGIRTYSCKCGKSYTEIIPACGHNFEAITTSTENDDGRCTFVCANCGKKYDYALDYQIIKKNRAHSDLVYEFQLTDDNLVTGFEPDGSIYVKVPISDYLAGARNVVVIRTNPDGSKTAVPATVEKGFLVIVADHFTPYEIKFNVICDEHIDENNDNTCDNCDAKIKRESVVRFIVNGEVLSTTTYLDRETIIAPDNPVKEGYIFAGWSPAVPETATEDAYDFVATWSAPEHTHNSFIAGTHRATCTCNGFTGDTYCADCGVLISAGEIIPSIGHDFTEWSRWVNNGNKRERYRVCCICGQIETESRMITASKSTVYLSLERMLDWFFFRIWKPIFALFGQEYHSKFDWE